MKYWIVAIFVMFVAKTCKEAGNVECENGIRATLQDLSGLDGCQWVLQLSNGDRLEPVNLDQFSLELENGRQVSLTYTPVTGMASICMTGQLIEIECISDSSED